MRAMLISSTHHLHTLMAVRIGTYIKNYGVKINKTTCVKIELINYFIRNQR